MNMVVVSDTSPIRALQALSLIWLLEPMFGSVLVPPAVARELAVPAPGIGSLDVLSIPCFRVQPPADTARVAALMRDVDPGEAEAIVLALEVKAEWILVDETGARRVATRLGLATQGVLALLVRAKHRGLIVRVAPLIEALDRQIHFRVSPQVRARVLADSGESVDEPGRSHDSGRHEKE